MAIFFLRTNGVQYTVHLLEEPHQQTRSVLKNKRIYLKERTQNCAIVLNKIKVWFSSRYGLGGRYQRPADSNK